MLSPVSLEDARRVLADDLLGPDEVAAAFGGAQPPAPPIPFARDELTAARARGRLGGRPPMPLDDPRIQTARKLHADQSMVIADICKTLQISRPTLYRWLALKSTVASPA